MIVIYYSLAEIGFDIAENEPSECLSQGPCTLHLHYYYLNFSMKAQLSERVVQLLPSTDHASCALLWLMFFNVNFEVKRRLLFPRKRRLRDAIVGGFGV